VSVDFNYFSTTRPDALASGLSAVATAVVLTDGSTFPDPALYGNKPYTIIMGYGTVREEVCTVTAKPAASTLTVTRGQDGTAATVKNAGDVVVHGVSAREFRSIADKVDLAGDTMTGALVLAGAPTQDLHASTKGYVDQSSPIGSIVAYAGATAPTGWHLCDGSAHGSTALQAVLALGGHASPTLTPNLRDKFILGDGGSQPTSGGASTVALSTANMPSHSHGGATASGNATHSHGGATGDDSPDHVHNMTGWREPNTFASGGITAAAFAGMSGTAPYGMFSSAGASARHAHAIGADAAAHVHGITAEGSGAAHENMPPFYALTYIIKKA
jgi:microcystin-dependent protein